MALLELMEGRALNDIIKALKERKLSNQNSISKENFNNENQNETFSGQ